MVKLLMLIFVILVAFYLQASFCADITDTSRLRAKILKNYDIYARPVQNDGNATVVKINFLSKGFEMAEQTNMITLNLVTVMCWEDVHVKWDPLNYGNLSEITFAPNELWRPEISVVNSFGESEIDHFSNTQMMAYSDSEVWWIPPSKFVVPCAFDFRLWPYDKQTCKVLISSWTHHGAELDFIIPNNITEFISETEWQDDYTENREWKLIGSRVERFSKVVYCCPEIPVVEILITVHVQRRSAAHTIAITAVGLGIATAVLISFWLDPFAQERLPLTLLMVLLNSIYLQYLHRIIPNSGNTVALSICFFRDSLIMVTFALTWTVLIRYIAKAKRNTPIPLSEFVQSFLRSFAATVLYLNPRPQSKGQTLQRMLEEDRGGEGEEGDASELVRGDDENILKEDWEWLARFLDRFAFFAYLITYIIFIIAFL